MKIDRHIQDFPDRRVKRGFTAVAIVTCLCTMRLMLRPEFVSPAAIAQSPAATQTVEYPPVQLAGDSTETPLPAVSQPIDSQPIDSQPGDSRRAASTASQASALINQVIDRLANGEAFDCKLRQTVRAAGREVVGVGTYLQVGGGTGQFSFQMNMHDGDGKHTLQQISDGRLTWTRTAIADEIKLSRVDVGWLDEGARTLDRQARIKPSMKVGGPSEMLDTLRQDYDLSLGRSKLGKQSLLVIIGKLKASSRSRAVQHVGGGALPDLYPTRIHIAIAADDDPKTGFGKGLPVRIEHWSDPIDEVAETGTAARTGKKRKLISLLEFYSIRPVTPPPVERFRFENQDAEINFVNETGRYENRFNIKVSAKQRARYR